MACGDYDPDNAGFLYPLFKNHELGFMLSLRLSLAKNEHGAASKFVKDVTKLKAEDFMLHYEQTSSFPPLLMGEFLENRKQIAPLTNDEFIASHKDTIEKAVVDLVRNATVFNSRNYSDVVVKDYGALKFHKDRQPEKYLVREEVETDEYMSTTITIRQDKAQVDTTRIASIINELAEIISGYRKLAGENGNFLPTSQPLDVYVHRTFALFRKDIPSELQQEIIDNAVKRLPLALKLTGWRITDQ